MIGVSTGDSIVGPSSPLVSVVVIAHNAERFIADALDSVFGQTYSNTECIVVDDGSVDSTSQIAARYKDVRLIRESTPSGSPGRSRNRGAAVANGQLLAFLDGDDLWSPNRLERMVTKLVDETADAALCGTRIVDFDLRPISTIRMRFPIDLRQILLWDTPTTSTGSNVLIARSAFVALEGYDPRLVVTQDWLMLARLLDSYKVAYVDEPLVAHRVHDSNLGSSVATMEHDMLLAYRELFAEWADRPELIAIRAKAYANLHRMLAGSYFVQGQLQGFWRNAARSLLHDPRGLGYFLGFPLRRLRARAQRAKATGKLNSPTVTP
jgi:glycosyltransferase involved in cell wall biosynthesis